MNNLPYEGAERRTFFRIIYPSSPRPTLIVGNHEFDIADISEGGIRFVNTEKIKLDKSVRGKVQFLHGKSLDIEATTMWEQDDEVGLLLKNYISPDTMEIEKQHVILISL